MHSAMVFFGRITMLVDENTHAFHFFISAMLQLFDRAGALYGELARFVLRLFGFKPEQKRLEGPPGGPNGPMGLPAPLCPVARISSCQGSSHYCSQMGGRGVRTS
eukprot:jgi/Mesvir1/11038/Mv02999-RA.1